MERKALLQQMKITTKSESKMLERMAGPFFRKLKLNYFVDPPFSLYHPFLNRNTWKEEHINKPKFFP